MITGQDVLQALWLAPSSVPELAQRLNVPPRTVSNRVVLLRTRGLVEACAGSGMKGDPYVYRVLQRPQAVVPGLTEQLLGILSSRGDQSRFVAASGYGEGAVTRVLAEGLLDTPDTERGFTREVAAATAMLMAERLERRAECELRQAAALRAWADECKAAIEGDPKQVADGEGEA